MLNYTVTVRETHLQVALQLLADDLVVEDAARHGQTRPLGLLHHALTHTDKGHKVRRALCQQLKASDLIWRALVPCDCSCGQVTSGASGSACTAWEWRRHTPSSEPPPPSSWSAPCRYLQTGSDIMRGSVVRTHTLLLRSTFERDSAPRVRSCSLNTWQMTVLWLSIWLTRCSVFLYLLFRYSYKTHTTRPLGQHTGLHVRDRLRAKRPHLQEVGGGLRQLIGQKLEVVLVELALQMGGHVLAVERAELADGAGERHPGKHNLVSHKHALETSTRHRCQGT